jgi:hypothetical protein
MKYSVWMLGALFIGAAGCAHPQTRLQALDETEKEKEGEVKTIGDVSSVDNANPVHVTGLGLVYNLEGTGGGAPPGPYRNLLEDQLRKRNTEHVKEILTSRDTSLVLLSAFIPPGAHNGDRVDIDVSVPRESKTTSLHGGQLLECFLYDYDSTKNVDPNYSGPDRLLKGHPLLKAEGPLMVGFGDGDESSRSRQARIWGGGRCRIDRPLYLVLNSDHQFARVAQTVADRINETFHGSVSGPTTDLALAKTKSVVVLNVAPQYRLNLPRYLRVVRLIPIRNTEASRIAYHRRLEEQLLDPAHTIMAALRLEALGQNSIPTLKRGLENDHPLVRFCSAEALAYLGSPSCGAELARMVEQQPALRAFSLTAMASLDEAICHVQLRKLLASSSPETRYGAFRALRALDENEESVRGERLNNAFWLHRVAPESSSLVHIATNRRPEVVLFGEDALLIAPFAALAGEFTVTAGPHDEQCIISRISLRHGKTKRQCSLRLEEVIRTLVDMGGAYADAVEMVRRLDRTQSINCRVALDALPQATSVYDLAKAGAENNELLKTDPEILKAKADFGATPTLFEASTSTRSD